MTAAQFWLGVVPVVLTLALLVLTLITDAATRRRLALFAEADQTSPDETPVAQQSGAQLPRDADDRNETT